MSYIYGGRERDDYDRPITIKRYVISSDDRDDRRDFKMNDPYSGERELVIRRKADRNEPLTISRRSREIEYDPPARRQWRDYERDYYEREYPEPYSHRRFSRSADYLERMERHPAPLVIREQLVIVQAARDAYVNPREPDYDMVRRSDLDDDPYYYQRRRRDLSPGDSIPHSSRRRDDRDDGYSSDDSMVYIRKETREYDDDHPHHKRHLAEGALIGAGAAELIRSHRKREGEEVSHGVGRAVRDAGAGALGAVAVNAAGHIRDYYRSKSRSRHRSHSFDDDRSRRHRRRSRGRYSRSRSRSHSHSGAKTLLELGLGAAAVAAGVAALRNKDNDERKSRSRTRSRSRGRASSGPRSDKDNARSQSQNRKHVVGAGLAGAAVAGLLEHAHSRSRSRKGKPERSRSGLRKALPVVAAGVGTAAATSIYERRKAEKEGKDLSSRERRRSRSRSRGPSEMYPDPSRDSAGLIEYGNDPVEGSIPAEHYYGQPVSPGPAYYSDGPDGYGRRHSRSRSRSRGPRYGGSSDSDRDSRRRRSKKHRSRSREVAEAALGATGLGYAAHKYSERRDRKKARSRERIRYDDAHHDPYEESYDPEPYPPSPPVAPHGPHPANNYYPGGNYYPPPPGSTPNLNATPQPYNPADYPPPPGAGPPPQPYGYGGAGPGPETYAPRPRRADENVSALQSSTLPTDQYHTRDGLDRHFRRRRRASSVPQPSQNTPPKSVAFDLSPDKERDPGYDTDNSGSTVHSPGYRSSQSRRHHRRRRSSSVPHSSPYPRSRDHRPSPTSSKTHTNHPQDLYKTSESESDSTIDLPDRFDAQGRLLAQKCDDPALEKLEDFMNRFARVLF